jgi:cytochrome c-type biogenesis protein CcmH/NrfG
MFGFFACIKFRDWTKVEEDCRKAIQLVHNSVKAHYMLGLALLQKKEFTNGVKELQRVRIFVSPKLFSVKFISGHDCLSRNVET